MQSAEIVQIKDDMPVTHYFIYKGQQYPFNYYLFKCYSNYIIKNQAKMEQSQAINIIDENEEKYIELSEEIIQDFIKFVHREPIELNDQNITKLYYLATKYEIPMLISCTEGYIRKHQKNIIVEMLLIQQKDPNFETKSYEEFISNDFLYYINDTKLLSLNFPIIYRILTKFKAKQEDANSDEVIEFLFKCLDQYGRKASVLFEDVDFTKSQTKYLKLIMDNYSNVFDFHFINSFFAKSMYEMHNEYVISTEKTKEKLKEQEENNEKMRKEFEIFKQAQFRNQEEQNDKIKKMKDQIDELKQMLDKQKENMTKEINLLKENYNEVIKNQLKITDQLNSCQFMYQKGKEFDGIINYLTKKTGGNIHDNGTIEITTNNLNANYPPKYVVDFNSDNYFDAHNTSLKNTHVCFDFKTRFIQLTNYSIQSPRCEDIGIKNWNIEVSKDGEQWEITDRHVNESVLKSANSVATFNISPPRREFYRFIRLIETGCSWRGENRYDGDFSKIEFFGKLQEPSQ